MSFHGYRQLLIFGGTFDPPHRAHVKLPRLVQQRLGADVIVYVPAGRSPHKPDQDQASAEHRLAMTRLAVEDDPNSLVLAIEIERGPDQPSYTVQTLEWLHARLDDNARMRLLIGVDQAMNFDRWRDPERIVGLAQPVVMLRPPQDAEHFLRRLPSVTDRAIWKNRLIELPAMPISATEIRRRLASNESVSDLVPAPVEDYIQRHGLYRQPLGSQESS